MKHVSIYWEKDSSDLIAMARALGNIGQECGDDGHELAVTEDELERLQDYIAEHEEELTICVYDTNDAALKERIGSWGKCSPRR